MTERLEQWICIKFYIKLEHSSMETIWMIQKATAVGNCWLAASSQRAHSCIMSCAEFFIETSNYSGDSAPYSPDLAPCDFWLFPKLKSPLKWKRFHTMDETQENTIGQLMVMGECCEVPRYLLWRGLRCHCPMYNISYILYLLQWMSVFFIFHDWIPSGQTSHIIWW